MMPPGTSLTFTHKSQAGNPLLGSDVWTVLNTFVVSNFPSFKPTWWVLAEGRTNMWVKVRLATGGINHFSLARCAGHLCQARVVHSSRLFVSSRIGPKSAVFSRPYLEPGRRNLLRYRAVIT